MLSQCKTEFELTVYNTFNFLVQKLRRIINNCHFDQQYLRSENYKQPNITMKECDECAPGNFNNVPKVIVATVFKTEK